MTYYARLARAGDVDANLDKAVLEFVRERVDGGQEGEVVRECVGGRRGQEAGLTQTASEHLPKPPRLGDVLLGTD